MLSSIISPSPGAVVITVVALFLMLLWNVPFSRDKRGPAGCRPPWSVLVVGTLINEAFGLWLPAWQLTAARQHVVQLPVPGSLAEFGGMFHAPDLRLLLRADLWVVAATIAIVGSIETLLCIEATDKIDPEKRISDLQLELRAQGVGNVVSGLLGWLAGHVGDRPKLRQCLCRRSHAPGLLCSRPDHARRGGTVRRPAQPDPARRPGVGAAGGRLQAVVAQDSPGDGPRDGRSSFPSW